MRQCESKARGERGALRDSGVLNVGSGNVVHNLRLIAYLEILEDLLPGVRLEVFTRRAKRELATHPKFFFFDAGVFRANRPGGPLDAVAELDGAALEGLVARRMRQRRRFRGK